MGRNGHNGRYCEINGFTHAPISVEKGYLSETAEQKLLRFLKK